MDFKSRAKKYASQSRLYLENAGHFIEIGEIEKASEFLWGSLTQALKALAARKEAFLGGHDEIRSYAIELSDSLKDEGIWYAFTAAQYLHTNFYEAGLKPEDVAIYAEGIKASVGKLLSLIPEEKSNK